MRPQEILGMVEEAAGTRMFEERKDKAKKTMAKKEKRVQELQNILDEEIVPKLEKLRAEKRSYIQFQKSVSELERIGRKLRAYEWTDGQARVAKREEEIDEAQASIKKVENDKKKAVKAVEAAEKEVTAVTKKRDAEMSKGGKLKKLQEEVGEQGKKLAKIRAQAEIKVETIKEEEKKVITLEAQLKEVRSTKNHSFPSYTNVSQVKLDLL